MRVAATLAALGIVVSATFTLVSTWQLRRWLRAQSAALGCALEYEAATSLIPGKFRLRSLQLTACDHGRWGVRVVRGEGEVALLSMIWGPIQPRRVELELQALRIGDFALDGPAGVTLERRVGAVHATVRAAQLTLRKGDQRLATSAHSRVDLQVPLGADTAPGSADFALQSFAYGPAALAAQKPVAGSVQVSWDGQVPRLELQDGHVASVPLLLGSQSFRATLQALRGSFTPGHTSASAHLLLEGPNVRLLLDALRAPQSLRFALSALEGAPFTFSSNVSYDSGEWTFHDIDLDTTNASVTGVASVQGSNRSGRLRFVYHGVAMGVQFANEQSDVVFNPAVGWAQAGI